MKKSETTEPVPELDSIEKLADKRILIIDDEPAVTAIVSTYLVKGGFPHVKSENDSRHAMALIRESEPDMVLLDISMPHLSGMEILEQISSDPDLDKVIVLMLSAAGKELEDRSYELGALGFLPKPARADAVIRIVSSTFRIANRFGSR